MAHAVIVEGITRLGTVLGHELIKCEQECSKADIIKSNPKVLPDDFFMEMISYARSIGKKIKQVDKNRELQIFQNSRR